MVAIEEILNSEIIRARIMQTGYDHLTKEEIRRIYIEETDKKPLAHITVYHSDDFNLDKQDSGFDGAVIS